MIQNIKKALDDFIEGVAFAPAWFVLSWQDIKVRYKRSTLGPFWITISLAITISFMGLLYAKIFKMEIHDYLPYLTAGMVHWTLISTLILEGTGIFSGNDMIIKQVRLPYSFYIFRMLSRNTMVWFHNLVVLIIVNIVMKPVFTLQLLWLPIAFIVIYIFNIGLSIIIGLLAVRFRDLQQIFASLTQLLFFLSPVMWMPSALGKYTWLMNFNPFYYFLELLRYPFDGTSILMNNVLLISSTISVVTFILGFLAFAKFRSRISYWV